jgi:hypothetical protein
MIINMQQQQQQQQYEDMYGNEVKRRRINGEGDHMKVWNMRFISYRPIGESEEMEEKQEPVRVFQEPVQVKHEEEPDQAPVQVQVQAPPHLAHLVGRNVSIETTGERIHHGRIVSLFDLNGERAVHIETCDGNYHIFPASQIYDLQVSHEEQEQEQEQEQMLSPIAHAGEEVIVIDDDEEVQQLAQIIEVIQIDSDEDSDAITQPLEDQDDYQDDFPDVEFQPARRQEEQRDQEQYPEQEQETECCAICFDATDPARNFVSLDCGHQFHFACIMSNLATGGHNRNNCPICRGAVYEVNMEAMDHHVNELVQHASMQNQYLQDELELTRQHREDLTAEYVRVMSMSMQIGLRHNQEREARDALERRAYICGLNERVAAVVTSAANNDLRRNGTFAHVEQQIRDLCMSFGMMAYDAQYDELLVQEQDPYADAMEVD